MYTKQTINTLSDSLSLSLFYKDSFAFILLLLPALTHSCTHKLFGNLSLSLSIHCTLLHKHSYPTQRTLWGWSKGFWRSEAEAHTWAAVCVWEGFDQSQGGNSQVEVAAECGLWSLRKGWDYRGAHYWDTLALQRTNTCLSPHHLLYLQTTAWCLSMDSLRHLGMGDWVIMAATAYSDTSVNCSC